MTAVLLDVTRTFSPKSIERPTGIDRVERAYVSYFLDSRHDVEFRHKQHVLTRAGMTDLLARADGARDWGRPDLRGLGRGLSGRIESAIRKHAQKTPPKHKTYLNVGHTNLDNLGALNVEKIVGFVHDMIPLDHPEVQTPKSAAQFKQRQQHLAKHADLIFTNSAFTATRVAEWYGSWGAHPVIKANLLGVTPPPAGPSFPFERPSFVILGTIEPRKNHKLLFDVWETFAHIPEPARPQLHIIGRRGWLNEEVFHFLDHSPLMGRDIIEHGSLPDSEVFAMLRGATALLFPSLVEGFGLPLLEAKCVGTPTLASDLDVFRELGGPETLYLTQGDATVWSKAVNAIIKQGSSGTPLKVEDRLPVSTWQTHFALLEEFL